MLELSSNGRPVVLSPGTSVQLELNSPLFDEEVVRGSYSYSFSVPAPPNGPLYGFPERLDADAAPGGELPAELRLDGLPLLTGTQRVRSASAKKYSLNLSATLGGLATALSARALHTFAFGGERLMPPAQPMQVPGWVLHANEVVRHPDAYDYVFAPVRVDDFYEPAPAPSVPPAPPTPPVPPAVLNPWVGNALVGNASGLPAGGTFTPITYKGYQRLVVPLYDLFNPANSVPYRSSEGEPLPVYGSFACPFPRLRYVLRCIFQESGLAVDDARFLPGELGELVIFSPANAVRSRRDEDGVVHSSLHLADALPDLSVAQLLQALRRALGVVVDVDPANGRVYSRYLRDVVAAPAAEADDWTDHLAGLAEVEIDAARALKLVYETDPDDAVTKDLLSQAPDPAALGPAVETLADLPTTGVMGVAPETRLVRQEAAYYRSGSVWAGGTAANLTWTLLSPQLSGVDVGGPNGEEHAQGFAFTQVGRAPFQMDQSFLLQLDPAATEWMEVPQLARPGFEPTDLRPEATPRPAVLRLLFWRGMQPASDGTLYPLVTPLHTNQAGAAVGALSLRLAGPAGTYEQLLRGWLEVKRRGVVVKQPLRLSTLDLARLDLTRKVRFDGIEYLVRKLSVALPLRKPAMAELVRV